MTQEEKDLLLKDLSARLPYGLKVKCGNTVTKEICELVGINAEISSVSIKDIWAKYYLENVASIKPYLRPLSSMTEEELKELKNYTGLLYDNLDLASFQNGTYKCLDFYLSEIPADVVIKVFDWLHMHHFDYRGLIKMRLALEAPEEMYKEK